MMNEKILNGQTNFNQAFLQPIRDSKFNSREIMKSTNTFARVVYAFVSSRNITSYNNEPLKP